MSLKAGGWKDGRWEDWKAEDLRFTLPSKLAWSRPGDRSYSHSRREVVYGTRRVPTTLLKSLQEWVIPLFYAYGGLGTVTGENRSVVVEW